ncbi:Na/Pi cotransporter family protein [Paraburkholderia pallida]|uniref:Na/Pi cotransporter family protein n=1 Tax=Paraburkholderia pallida TaxID=2547399 RepID=A0A4P7D376_9BURK|nr:Na/Pi cotransporter family protein [Paraburkholderia pallida]QBR03079.1 Na/Pi cotransporter family protein [Paraburkholderia pallida]
MTPDPTAIDQASLNLVQMFGVLIGGLALFLLGLQFMTGGFKAIAGSRLQMLLGVLTANRFRGVVAGALVTALLNSSTITTVLMVGFVSAGLMTLAQSVPMIMGANIGSTITAQIIAFDVSRLMPFMLAIGFAMYAFGKRDLVRRIGEVVMGLGLLFLGIEFMGDATRPLRTYPPFIDAMQNMEHPLLGILVGAAFTAIVQSSAATLAIVIALGAQGLMPLEAGIALILGANVGTCGTALLASIGKSAEAIQVGVVHLIFNVLGVLFWAFFIPQMAELARFVSPSYPELQGVARLAAETPRQVANTHTIFSVANTLVLIWFSGWIARLARMIVRTRTPETKPLGDPAYLDETSLGVPSLGLQRVRLEVSRLGNEVVDIVRDGTHVVVNGSIEEINALLDRDKEADRLSAEILHYVGRLSKAEHSEQEGLQMVGFTQVVANLENISDIIGTNLMAVSQQRLTERIELTRLNEVANSRFAEVVMQNLAAIVETIGEAGAIVGSQGIGTKGEIKTLAAQARQGILGDLQLAQKSEVLDYQLAVDMIEEYKQIARLSRGIAKVVGEMRGKTELSE